MRKRFVVAWDLTKQTCTEWNDDNALRLSAALSYYTVFSLGPLILLATSFIGLFYGQEAAQGQLFGQLRGLLGAQGAEAIQAIVAGARKTSTGILASILGVVMLMIGASGVFAELKSSLNEIWEVSPKKVTGVMALLKDRLLSIAMVLSIGFLLLVSLIANAALAAMGKYMGGVLPIPAEVLQIAEFLISFGVVTVLFAMIFKVLPEIDVAWRDVWPGAVLTAFLFNVGKFAIGLYLGKSGVASTFGAAASVVIVMLWAYYSSVILFFGAEFTQVYARRHGSRRHESEVKQRAKALPEKQKEREATLRSTAAV